MEKLRDHRLVDITHSTTESENCVVKLVKMVISIFKAQWISAQNLAVMSHYFCRMIFRETKNSSLSAVSVHGFYFVCFLPQVSIIV